MRPVDVIRRVAPQARAEYVQAFEQGDSLFAAAGITTPARLAHFLAQILHESGGLTLERENMNYSAPRLLEIFGVHKHSAAISPDEAAQIAHHPEAIAERVYGLGNPKKARELGNTEPGDAYEYRGGGILQTTGRKAFRRYGFETCPAFIVDSDHALKPALAEWTESKCNALADKGDIHAITARINGGQNGFASRVAWLRKVEPLIDRVDLNAAPTAPAAPAKPKPPAAVKTEHVATGSAVAAVLALGHSHPEIAMWAVVGIAAVGAAVVLFQHVRKRA